MTIDTSQIGNRSWGFAHILRGEGLVPVAAYITDTDDKEHGR